MTNIIETTPIITTEPEPSTDDFLKVLWNANKEQKIQAFRILKGVDEQAPSPVVVKRIQFEKMYTSKDVSKITGLHRNTIGKATRRGELRFTRRGLHTPYLYTESAVQDWLNRGGIIAAGASENPNTEEQQHENGQDERPDL